MASSSLLSSMVLMSMLLASTHYTEAAITCGQVASSLNPCLSYLTKGGPVQPACCNGIQSLNNAAKTTPDRQSACKCLKIFSSSISGVNLGFASALPAKCGISIPYKISPSTDCSTVN